MGTGGNRFSPQLPVGFDHAAALYAPHREFRASLATIAEHIAGGGEPMTFALYGPWGTGKSTALSYLRGLVHKLDDSVTFSRYEAPLWSRHPDERSTLALQILRGAGRAMPANVAALLAGFLKYDRDVFSGQTDPDDYDLATSLGLLDVLATVPHAPPVVEEWIRRYLTRKGPIRHVVMIDDLDRCELDYVARLLKATAHWMMGDEDVGGARHGAGIYFVLACREDVLVASQQDGEVADPQQSLEKYVHVAVTIPRLLSTPAESAGYLTALVRQLVGIPGADRERLADMITESGATYPNGLFAPLLRVDGRASTPRAVKARLNLALTEIDAERLDDEALVKEWMIKAFWPEFWSNQYRDLLVKDEDGRTVFDRLNPVQRVGSRLRELVDMTDDALADALVHLAREVRADLADVTPQLAIYLASAPHWPQRPDPAGIRRLPRTDPTGALAQRSSVDSESKDRPPADWTAAPTPSAQTASADEGLPAEPGTQLPSDPQDQVLYFYLVADTAEDQGDSETVQHALQDLLDVARQLGSQISRSSTVGNAALIAERAGLLDIAYELHQLALLAEPDHYNMIQNYLDFVLANNVTQDYHEALRLYEVLAGPGRAHKPFRTLLLGLRIDTVIKGSVPDRDARVAQVLEFLAADPSISSLWEILKVQPDAFGYGNFAAACRLVAERTTEQTELSIVLRIMATGLGGSSDPVHERAVVDLERWLLSIGEPCATGPRAFAMALNNLGLQLGSLGYRKAATLTYAAAYRIDPSDASYRRSLAGSLERMERNEDATAVLLGRPVEITGIEPEPLPAQLSETDGTDRWWEALPVLKRAPCPSGLPWIDPGGAPAAPGSSGARD